VFVIYKLLQSSLTNTQAHYENP